MGKNNDFLKSWGLSLVKLIEKLKIYKPDLDVI